MKLNKFLEHTLLGNNIDEQRIRDHIKEAIDLDVFGVCVPIEWVALAKKELENTNIKIITVIDFPLGKKSTHEKCQEAALAASLGADELDLVLDYQALINKNYEKAYLDLKQVVDFLSPVPVKIIVETSALTREQLICAITLVALSGAKFIKTSTGFHDAGAQIHDIALMRALLPDNIEIKASGGIRNFDQAYAMTKAGATRIGCSQSRQILQNNPEGPSECY